MGIIKPFLQFLVLFLIACDSFAEIFYNFEIDGVQNNPCINKCKEAPLPLANKNNDPDGKYVSTCCQRGCRFFNLVDLHHKVEPNHVNNTLDACDASCTEAYSVVPDLVACKIGCAVMANHHISNSLFSIAIQIEDEIHPNILLLPPGINDNDPLSDTAIEKQFVADWWNSDGFKLPELDFKSVPIDSGVVDYSVSSEYLEENEKSSIPGSDWLQCASRHTGIPRWVLAFAIAAAILSAMWLCFAPEKPCECNEKVGSGPLNSNKITVYLPDESPLFKKPPPKYSEIMTNNDSDIPV